jgi:hypothetical protein
MNEGECGTLRPGLNVTILQPPPEEWYARIAERE